MKLAITLAALVLLTGGCRTKVAGGTARHDTGGFRAEVPTPSGVVVIVDDRDTVTTTQPSVETNTGQLPTIGAAKEGMLGSLSLAALPAVNRSNLILGGGMIAIGLFLIWSPLPFFKQPGTGIICICAGVVTMLYPLAAAIGAGIAGIYFIFKLHKKQKADDALKARLVTSVDHAMQKELTPAEREEFKARLAEGQNVDDVEKVKSLKAKPKVG